MDQLHESCSEAHKTDHYRVWDTDHVRQDEAFELYRDGVCSAFMPLRPERPTDQSMPFRSRHVSHDLGDVALNLVNASPHPVFKDKREISASAMECFYLNLQLSGQSRITQADGTVELKSGQIAIFDSSRPFAMDHGDTKPLKVASLMIPKALLPNAQTVSPRLLSDHPIYGSALCQAASTLHPTARSNDQQALLKLRDVVLGLTDLSMNEQSRSATYHDRRDAQYFKICALIKRHCADADVTINEIATMARLSVGSVRNIFTENDDTFGRRQQYERIECAKIIFSETQNDHLTIAEVAYKCGFVDPTHFGRVFKSNTGMSPGAWRALLRQENSM